MLWSYLFNLHNILLPISFSVSLNFLKAINHWWWLQVSFILFNILVFYKTRILQVEIVGFCSLFLLLFYWYYCAFYLISPSMHFPYHPSCQLFHLLETAFCLFCASHQAPLLSNPSLNHIVAFHLSVTIFPWPVDYFLTKQITKPEKDKSRHKIFKSYSLFSLDANSGTQHDLPFIFVSSLFKRMQVNRHCLCFSLFLFV